MEELTEICEQCGEAVTGWLDHAEQVYTFRCEEMSCLNFWQVGFDEL